MGCPRTDALARPQDIPSHPPPSGPSQSLLSRPYSCLPPPQAPTNLAGKVTESQAIAAADRDPNVAKEEERNGTLTHSASVNEDGVWEVAYFADGKEVALVLVDRRSGEVTESWTGYQVAWKMARGYSGQFGHKLNAPYVFLPLCAIFLLGLVDWRRWRRVANLDLLVLLAFGVSHFFFNRGEIGVSVPLQYPALLYLLGRALWIGFRGRGEGLRPVWPLAWILVAALFLMGFRVGLNMADSGSTDIGYAGVVGADRIAHGEPIYGNFPDGISDGDTYGPVNYYAYVPFERIWPWSGKWDDLPASHGAAVAFDLLTFGFLILLGIRIRPGPAGRRLAAILAFGWAAYPYSAMPLESNSNDSLVALLLVATLLVLSRPLYRGATLALATFAKFSPALLAPMLLTYSPTTPELEGGLVRRDEGARERTPRPQGALISPRNAALFAAGFLAVTIIVMAWPAINPGSEHVLRPDYRVPVRQGFPVQHLGAGGLAEPTADGLDRGDRSTVSVPSFPPKEEVVSSGSCAGDGIDHPAPTDVAALVLPVHRLVVPALPGGAGDVGDAGY